MKKQNMTKAQLCRKSGVPWATLSDICSGKTALSRVSVQTAIQIAHALHCSVEELFGAHIQAEEASRPPFEQFKGTTCHRLRRLGDISFLIEVIENDEIGHFYRRQWYPESFYLLAMIDFLCKRNDIPLCSDYDNLRQKKLQRPLYPSYAWIPYLQHKDTSAMRKCRKEAIPEFLRFNIIEGDIDNVV